MKWGRRNRGKTREGKRRKTNKKRKGREGEKERSSINYVTCPTNQPMTLTNMQKNKIK